MRETSFGSGEQQDESWEAGYSLRDAITAIRRRWWIVAAAFVVTVALMMLRTMQQPRLYRAAATVRVQQGQSPIAGMQVGPQYDFRIDRLLSEQQVIRSQVVAERVAQSLGLRLRVAHPPDVARGQIFGDKMPVVDTAATGGEFLLSLGERDYTLSAGNTRYGRAPYGMSVTGGGITVTVPSRPDLRERAVVLELGPLMYASGEVRGGITTRVLPQTDIVEIAYTGTDPQVVKAIANAVAERYAEYSREAQRENARGKSLFIEQKLAEQEKMLAVMQDSLSQFRQRHHTSGVVAEQGAQGERIYRLEEQLQAALVEQRVYESLIGKLTQADTTDEELRKLVGTEAVSRNSSIAVLYTRWFELQKERQQLTGTRTSANRDVQTIDSLIVLTKRDLQISSRVYLQGLRSRISSYQDNISRLRAEGERFPPLAAEEARLMGGVETLQKIFDSLQEQYQLARIAESADAGSVRLIDSATLPLFAVSPNRRRALMMAILLGLFLGVGLAMLLERLDDSVKSPDEIRERMDLSVLGSIPAIDARELETAEGAPSIERLIAHARPKSPVAEAYRSLRTNLAFAKANRDLRTIVFTSPGPADGKSTTVANLAITFAQQGQRTLVIDADLRRAVMDKTFSVPRSPGLTDVIIGNVTLAQAVSASQVPNLSVLGSGQFPPNPSELLGSPAMRGALAQANELFDVVLIDSPPLLAVTDAAVLSTIADATVLVIRMGSTAREAVRRAVALLRAVHGTIAGAVLNDVDMRGGKYYGGYGYYYYYASAAETNGNGAKPGVMDRLRALRKPSRK